MTKSSKGEQGFARGSDPGPGRRGRGGAPATPFGGDLGPDLDAALASFAARGYEGVFPRPWPSG